MGLCKMKRAVIAILALSLLVPEFSFAHGLPPAQGTGSGSQAASSSSTPPTSSEPRSPALHRRHTRRSRSDARETQQRRHGISKGEKVFLVSVVGTSMGIGALAGGPKGLAIGAIVGGWGAYGAHRLWRWIK